MTGQRKRPRRRQRFLPMALLIRSLKKCLMMAVRSSMLIALHKKARRAVAGGTASFRHEAVIDIIGKRSAFWAPRPVLLERKISVLCGDCAGKRTEILNAQRFRSGCRVDANSLKERCAAIVLERCSQHLPALSKAAVVTCSSRSGSASAKGFGSGCSLIT